MNGIEDKLRGATGIIGGSSEPKDTSVIQLVHGISERPTMNEPTTPAQAVTAQQGIENARSDLKTHAELNETAQKVHTGQIKSLDDQLGVVGRLFTGTMTPETYQGVKTAMSQWGFDPSIIKRVDNAYQTGGPKAVAEMSQTEQQRQANQIRKDQNDQMNDFRQQNLDIKQQLLDMKKAQGDGKAPTPGQIALQNRFTARIDAQAYCTSQRPDVRCR